MDIKERVAEKLYHIDHPNISDWSKSDLKELYRKRADSIIPLVRADTLKEIKKDIKHLGYATMAEELGISLQLVRADCQRELAKKLDECCKSVKIGDDWFMTFTMRDSPYKDMMDKLVSGTFKEGG